MFYKQITAEEYNIGTNLKYICNIMFISMQLIPISFLFLYNCSFTQKYLKLKDNSFKF